MLIGTLAAVSVVSCKKKDDDDDVTPESYVLSGDVAANKTLSNDKAWTLKGYVYVKSGATLTIPAGTIIKSDIVEKGALIVEPGGKIMAEGTAAKPIVFTSGVAKGQRRAGDWGGIIILGNAPTNRATPPTIEGGVNRTYGGSNAADNSGVLRYVRIEFAGIAAAPNSEINGLTLGAVGSGTVIENVMVAYGNDDAFEFFGGTVNAKNLIAYACADDDYDFDFGYVGSISNAISFKHPQIADPADASNGIECDNDGTGTEVAPYTHPKLMNFTLVGPNAAANTQANHNFGARWRRATHFSLDNSIMIGHQKGGFSIESAATLASYLTGTSTFKNNLVHATTSAFKGADSTATAQITAKATADGSVKLAKAEDAGLTDPFKVGAPNFAPKAGSDAQIKGVGAITGTDWTTGWANWDPNNADY